MRFRVTRASMPTLTREMPGKQPCEEARIDGQNWVMEVEDLPHLLELVGKYGDIIVGSSEAGSTMLIYDSWIE